MDDPEFLAMSLEEAMPTQRAIRRLKTDPVDDALVLQLLELAIKAPIWSNAGLLWFYTPAVVGSIPIAPTSVSAVQGTRSIDP